MNAFIPFQFDGRQVGANTLNDFGTVRGFKFAYNQRIPQVGGLSLQEKQFVALLRSVNGKDRSFLFRLLDTIAGRPRIRTVWTLPNRVSQ